MSERGTEVHGHCEERFAAVRAAFDPPPCPSATTEACGTWRA
jgi:hypothetical protein